MKRTILVLLLMAASTQLKAQAWLQAKPDLKPNDGLQNYFKPRATPSPKDWLLQPPTPVNSNDIIIYSNMPVVKVASTDRMPILTFNNNGPYGKYTMLIKKVDINPVAPAQKQNP